MDPILSRIIELYPQVESRQRSWADVAGELGQEKPEQEEENVREP